MLKLVSFSFSPSAFPASLQTSTVQACNAMTGVEMSIFEKIDTARHRRDIYLCRPMSQPDATGFSGAEPDGIPNPSVLFEAPSQEPTIPAKSVTPLDDSVRRLNPQRPPVSKTTEA
jgi:hypothetical protein